MENVAAEIVKRMSTEERTRAQIKDEINNLRAICVDLNNFVYMRDFPREVMRIERAEKFLDEIDPWF